MPTKHPHRNTAGNTTGKPSPEDASAPRTGKKPAAPTGRLDKTVVIGIEKPAVQAVGKQAGPSAREGADSPPEKVIAKAAPQTASKRGKQGEPARKKAASQHAVPIYQIYFSPEQGPALDSSFIPLDNSANTDPLHEFAVFERLARDESLSMAPLWGALSWRFGVKTGMSGAALHKAIAAHPGHDLYYFNPFPEHEALFINGWQQGSTSHPAFVELCTAVFVAAGLDVGELGSVHSSQSVSTCNYFIGSPAFWNLYLPWVRGVLDRARAGVPVSVRKVLDSPLSDPDNRHAGSSYWPFIVERLLPLFLASEGKALKPRKLVLPVVEARLNTHLQRLREMKDVAHRTRSRWLYACWLNYRNLYLFNTAGPDWCRQFLSQISSIDPDFR